MRSASLSTFSMCPPGSFSEQTYVGPFRHVPDNSGACGGRDRTHLASDRPLELSETLRAPAVHAGLKKTPQVKVEGCQARGVRGPGGVLSAAHDPLSETLLESLEGHLRDVRGGPVLLEPDLVTI